MRYEVFDRLPQEAAAIRKSVFVEEQGFHDEFGETDNYAKHIVAFQQEQPIATCRFFEGEEKDTYIIGRLAVLKKYRGMKTGSAILEKAEMQIRALGGRRIILHAQQQAAPFYQKLGYQAFGEADLEEGVAHIWMGKALG